VFQLGPKFPKRWKANKRLIYLRIACPIFLIYIVSRKINWRQYSFSVITKERIPILNDKERKRREREREREKERE